MLQYARPHERGDCINYRAGVGTVMSARQHHQQQEMFATYTMATAQKPHSHSPGLGPIVLTASTVRVTMDVTPPFLVAMLKKSTPRH